MANISYKLFNKGLETKNFNLAACFSLLPADGWDKLHFFIKPTNNNLKYKDFWFDLIKKIESTIETSECKNYVIVNNSGSRVKNLFLLSLIRYISEYDYDMDSVVIMTKKIIDLLPDIDPLTACIVAASNLNELNTNHSIVNFIAKDLKTVNDYINFNANSCFEFCLSDNNRIGGTEHRKWRSIVNSKKDPLDIEPILKHYKLI